MRLCIGLLAAVALAGSLVAAGRALSQDTGTGAAPPTAAEPKKEVFKGADPREHDPAEMQKRWMDSMKPNQFHEKLARHIGDWDLEVSILMDPSAPPMKEKGSSKISWLFPGRWVKEEIKSSMMGMPFEGLAILGYDNFKKKYVGSFVDSMGTSLATMEGNFGMDGKTMLLYGTMNEPMTGEQDKTVMYVVRDLSEDEFVFEIHDMTIGETGNKVMEMHYKRRK